MLAVTTDELVTICVIVYSMCQLEYKTTRPLSCLNMACSLTRPQSSLLMGSVVRAAQKVMLPITPLLTERQLGSASAEWSVKEMTSTLITFSDFAQSCGGSLTVSGKPV